MTQRFIVIKPSVEAIIKAAKKFAMMAKVIVRNQSPLAWGIILAICTVLATLGGAWDTLQAIKQNATIQWNYYRAESYFARAEQLDIELLGARATKNYRRAASRGHSLAKAALARRALARGDRQGADHAAQEVRSQIQLVADKDGRAAFALAHMFYNGYGAVRDRNAALEYFERSAELGYPRGQRYLGSVLHFQMKGPENSARAFRLWQQAAEQGDIYSVALVGQAYALRYGVARSPKKAKIWLETAAARGHLGAQTLLGRMYRLGDLGEADLAKAEAWYKRAIDGGYPRALWEYGVMIAEAWQQGVLKSRPEDPRKWLATIFSQAVKHGFEQAEWSLGYIYLAEFGPDDVPEFDLAYPHLVNAARHGEPHAHRLLAKMYKTGRGTKIDHAQARFHAKTCAETESSARPMCLRLLGRMYRDGLGGPQNLDRAIDKFREALRAGEISVARELSHAIRDRHGTDDATMNQERLDILQSALKESPDNAAIAAAIAWLYAEELPGVSVDPRTTSNAFLAAAKLGSPSAACEIGSRYLAGEGIKKNVEEGVNWLRVAADGGAVPPLLELDRLSTLGHDIGLSEEEFDQLARTAVTNLESKAHHNGCRANIVARAYERGVGVKKNLSLAAQWYERAADRGSISGAYNLGRLHLSGQAPAPNPKRGVELLKYAAERGSAHANLYLASILETEEVLPADEGAVYEYYGKAVSLDPELMTKIDPSSLELRKGLIRAWPYRFMTCDGALDPLEHATAY